MPPQNILKSRGSEILFEAFSVAFFSSEGQSWAKIKTRQLPRLASCQLRPWIRHVIRAIAQFFLFLGLSSYSSCDNLTVFRRLMGTQCQSG